MGNAWKTPLTRTELLHGIDVVVHLIVIALTLTRR
jgi:hypothetical protein